ncbi:MAG: stage II sporulation protein R [Lachnospiraceae bacterium]|nr:stage II sporulation protein R [Lachnospiraceae bacterium]
MMEGKRVVCVLSALLVIAVAGVGMRYVQRENMKRSRLQHQIATKILRLHIIANSDSRKDQKVKRMVRDALLLHLRPELEHVKNKEEAKAKIQTKRSEICKVAERTMASAGYAYKATATIEWCDFPVRKYGKMTFPAGRYEALRVKLGNAKGHNWWCVMYPTLCYTSESCQEITEENESEFKEILSDEEYEAVTYTFSQKGWEWIRKLQAIWK